MIGGGRLLLRENLAETDTAHSPSENADFQSIFARSEINFTFVYVA